MLLKADSIDTAVIPHVQTSCHAVPVTIHVHARRLCEKQDSQHHRVLDMKLHLTASPLAVWNTIHDLEVLRHARQSLCLLLTALVAVRQRFY